MVCIYCASKTRVANSRPQKKLLQVWRRRACTTCGALFTTNESVDLSTSLSVRSIEGSLRPFSRDKLYVSVLRACGHRPDAVGEAADLVATIIAKIRIATSGALVDYDTIVALTLETLQRFDTAAGVHYGAYHHKKA